MFLPRKASFVMYDPDTDIFKGTNLLILVRQRKTLLWTIWHVVFSSNNPSLCLFLGQRQAANQGPALYVWLGLPSCRNAALYSYRQQAVAIA